MDSTGSVTMLAVSDAGCVDHGQLTPLPFHTGTASLTTTYTGAVCAKVLTSRNFSYVRMNLYKAFSCMPASVSQCSTVVRNCYKGDVASQWEIAIFGHLGL